MIPTTVTSVVAVIMLMTSVRRQCICWKQFKWFTNTLRNALSFSPSLLIQIAHWMPSRFLHATRTPLVHEWVSLSSVISRTYLSIFKSVSSPSITFHISILLPSPLPSCIYYWWWTHSLIHRHTTEAVSASHGLRRQWQVIVNHHFRC